MSNLNFISLVNNNCTTAERSLCQTYAKLVRIFLLYANRKKKKEERKENLISSGIFSHSGRRNNSTRAKRPRESTISRFPLFSFRSPTARPFLSARGAQETPIKLIRTTDFQWGMLLNARAWSYRSLFRSFPTLLSFLFSLSLSLFSTRLRSNFVQA